MSARMQHYGHPSRYFEQTAEPPPAHRPVTSHTSLAALPGDLKHPLATPDRPLSSHSALSERPLSHLSAPDRPLSALSERSLSSLSERPLSSLSDRSLSSHTALDRPLSGHSLPDRTLSHLSMPERSLSTHLPPERPLSNHGLALTAGLGAAGNLMGAVARHVGADAPATHRGLQAATPPHASQVPPQADSLYIILKVSSCRNFNLFVVAMKNKKKKCYIQFKFQVLLMLPQNMKF